jgi:transposase
VSIGASRLKMKAYSINLREKIVNTYEKGGTSIRKVAVQFGVAKSYSSIRVSSY